MALQQTNIFSNIVAFTRASSATYFDSTGKLRTATTNTPRFDYNPITLALRGILVEEQRTNLVTYSESFSTGWVTSLTTNSDIIPNTVSSPSGAQNAGSFVCSTTTSAVARRLQTSANITTLANTTYTFTIYIKYLNWQWVNVAVTGTTGISDGISATFNVQDGAFGVLTQSLGTGTFSSRSITSVGNGWYRVSITGILSTSGTAMRPKIVLVASGAGGVGGATTGVIGAGVYVWGAQLEAGDFSTSYIPSSVTFSGRTSDGTYFDSTGTLRTAGSGVARMQYDPANLSADPFLLLEESRTNSIPNNMMVGAARGTPGTAPTGWIAGVNGSGLTIQLVGMGTENGIAYVDYRFSGTTSTATEFFVQPTTGTTVAASNEQTWTGSFYVRAVAGSITNINNARVITRGVDSSSAALTIGTGSDVKNSLNVSSIDLLRPATRVTTADAATAAVQTYFGCSHDSGVAIDITLRIGMPQLEQGAGATSVIPTSSVAITRSADTSTSATATRSADVASINTLDPWYNASEGTIYAEATAPVANIFKILAEGASATDFKDFSISFDGLRGNFVSRFSAGNYDVLGPANSLTAGATVKLAGSYNSTNADLAYNGTLAVTKNANAQRISADRVFLGSRQGTSLQLNGHLCRVTYYPRRLTNAELRALTT